MKDLVRSAEARIRNAERRRRLEAEAKAEPVEPKPPVETKTEPEQPVARVHARWTDDAYWRRLEKT